MENTKIENISDIRLDFFLKQSNVDVRIILEPGDIVSCDLGSTTKSMLLYARKNLIKIHDASENVDKLVSFEVEKETIKLDETSEVVKEISIDISPNKKTALEINILEDETCKEVKKYTGKKRGRKKKRGPKPGAAKKKKVAQKNSTIEEDKISFSGSTNYSM